uniref:Conjugal transfer protein n=2 Tax=Schistosoma mansoni TaxID=6183 RepID=A0A3Q0KQC9_SCHMA
MVRYFDLKLSNAFRNTMLGREFFRLFLRPLLYRISRKYGTLSITTCCFMYPIKLSHISTETIMSTNQYIEYPLLSSLQLQIDSTISFINQLLREYHTILINLEHTAIQYGELQLSYMNSDEENDELLLELRSQWSTLAHKLDNIEITIRSAVNTLQNSLETAFLYEEYIKTTPTKHNHLLNETLISQAGLAFHTIEKKIDDLKNKRKDIVTLWSTQIAENIKRSGNS